jgi:pectate lyase
VGTLGGRGGELVRVTNLNPEGPGSLRAAIESPEPRIVVFEVAGTIDLNGKSLRVRNPFITIAGQTAPSPGITLIKGEFTISTHDVIVQHLSFRPGSYGRPARSGHDQDGLNVLAGAHKVVIDHCSFSWGTDENLSVGGQRFEGVTPEQWRRSAGHEITFSYNLIYEGLSKSVHPKGEHSKGSLIHDNSSGIFIYRNIYASNQERNPLLKGGVYAAVVNNLIYNPGTKAIHYNLIESEWNHREHSVGKISAVGNVLRYGPDTRPRTPLFSLGGAGSVELHAEDNLAIDFSGQDAPLLGRYTSGQPQILVPQSAYLPPRLSPIPSNRLESELMKATGARPWDRSHHDRRVLSDIAEARGRIIDREEEIGGFEKTEQKMQPFDARQWNLWDMSPQSGWNQLGMSSIPSKLQD